MALADYVEVKDRIPIFWDRYPDGALRTDMVRFEGDEVVFCAYLYRAQSDEKPLSTGWAHEIVGSSNVNKTSALENCETSAIGRALANLGITGPTGAEPRPSREEMRKVGNGKPQSKPTTPGGGAATQKQIGMIEMLMKSHHFTDEERAGLEKRMSDGMEKGTASKAIEWLQDTKKERVAAEREQAVAL